MVSWAPGLGLGAVRQDGVGGLRHRAVDLGAGAVEHGARQLGVLGLWQRHHRVLLAVLHRLGLHIHHQAAALASTLSTLGVCNRLIFK